MSQSSADNSIPLLTEVIAQPNAPEHQAPQALQWDDNQPQHNQPQYQPDYQQHFQPEPIQAFQPQYQPTYDAAPVSVSVSTPLPPPAVAPEPSAEQLRQIRQDIQENVMQTLLGQVDSVLHQHLQDDREVILQ
ncbi:hypothetical protein E6R62_38360, partial [Streptomyces sp. A1136]